MGAILPFPTASGAMPPARTALVALKGKIADAEEKLDRLVHGRDRLRAELSRADTAKNELEVLITDDASSLVGKLRSGVSWALSNFGSPRAMTLVAQLSESRVQHEVGAKALGEIDGDIAVLEREIADLKARKPDAIRSVMIEAAGGFRGDLLTAIDDRRYDGFGGAGPRDRRI